MEDAEIAEYNRTYLNREGPTNVIAFPMREGDFTELTPYLLGDVVISAETARRESEAAGLTTEERFDQLLVHGILHLFGYDHEQDPAEAGRMESKSGELLALIRQSHREDGPMKSPTLAVTTRSPEETRKLGRTVGRCLFAGMTLYLMGDMGSGKTAFVQGLAQGLEVPPEYTVTSPTFTLVNEYPGRLSLYHIDLYRLEDAVDFEEIGLYDLPEEEAVAAVEWAERLHSADRGEGITIRFEIQDEKIRRLHMIASGLAAGDLIREVEKIAKERRWV